MKWNFEGNCFKKLSIFAVTTEKKCFNWNKKITEKMFQLKQKNQVKKKCFNWSKKNNCKKVFQLKQKIIETHSFIWNKKFQLKLDYDIFINLDLKCKFRFNWYRLSPLLYTFSQSTSLSCFEDYRKCKRS